MEETMYRPDAGEGLHPLVCLAREAVESFVGNRQLVEPAELSAEMEEQAGVFVCLKVNGELRGCIGTFKPTCENVAREVVANAIQSATRDPRFPPVTRKELPLLTYAVDVLAPPEAVESLAELDARRYGVIVEALGPGDRRRGLLLPDLEGVDEPATQIAIARRKAGIGPQEPVRLYRFEVKRYQ